MQVKQSLRIHTFASAAGLLVVIMVMAVTAKRVDRAFEAARLADAIITASHERLILRVDNHRTLSDRSREQLIAKHKQIGELLETASRTFWQQEDRETVQELLAIHGAIGKYSSAIRLSRERSGVAVTSDPVADQHDDRLTRQLDMKVYETILLNTRLQKSADEAVASSLWSAGCAILLTILAVGSLTLVNSINISRIVAARIGRLRDGAAVIGGGDFSRRIEVEGEDEFSWLAGSLNEMTSKLSASYCDLEREIDGHRRAEEALQESESFYRQTLESIPGMVFTTRPDGYCDYQSQQWVEFTGVPMVEHLGDGWNRLLHPDDRPRAFQAWRDAVEDRAPYDLEYRVRRSDGEYKWFKVIGRPIRDAGGEIVRWFGVAADIDAIKESEIVRKKAYADLERLADERARTLKEKEVLLKEIHHRVKNNLQVISSLVRLQAEGIQDETVREELLDVTYRVRSMALVHEKLYQSRDLAAIDFGEYAKSLLNFLWRSHGQVAASIGLNLKLEPVPLTVDTAVPCGLILNELAVNAVKHAFTGREAGEVTVTLAPAADGLIRLTVADDGVGMPEQPDWRQATSLGLRLVLMLAKQIGADVELTETQERHSP